PAGSVVKERFLVDPRDIWDNVTAYRSGFAIRVHDIIYFYDNAGALKGQANLNTSGETFDTGRGDATRIAGHINSPYVYLAGNSGGVIKIAAWDSRDQSFVAVANVSEAGFSAAYDRVNLAVDALDRVTIAYEAKPQDWEQAQIVAGILALNEAGKAF